MNYISLLQIDPTALPKVNITDSVKVVTENMVHQIKDSPDEFFDQLLDKMIMFGVKLVAAFLIYFIGVYTIKFIRRRLRQIFAKKNTERTVATFTMSLVTVVMYVLLLIISVSTLGVNTTSIAALLAAGGMAIGMALSGTVQNFAGGIMILIFKPFKSGDLITAQGFTGFVDSITIMSTKIITPDNRTIIIPNGILSNGTIDNSSTTGLRRIEWKFNVEYGTDSDKCIEIITKAIQEHPLVLDSGTPGASDVKVFLSDLNDIDISFTARAWVIGTDYGSVLADVTNIIYKTLPQCGINFAFPQVDVNIKNYNPPKS